MTQDDFSKNFLNLAAGELPPARDPNDLAREIVRRDKGRTRLLACASLFFWLLATAGMLLLVYGLNRFIIAMRISNVSRAVATSCDPATNQAMSDATTQPTTQALFARAAEDQMSWGTSLLHHSMPYIAGAIVSLMLAALFTVLLVFSSRRATLNRINISLMQMSEQLREMRRTPS
jgi:hypothetical protein